MGNERGPKKGTAWDVPVTAAVISAGSFLSEAITSNPDATAVAVSTLPAVAAGLARKRYFAYSLLLGSAAWAVTDSALAYVVMLPVAGTFFGVAMSKRIGDPKQDDHFEIH